MSSFASLLTIRQEVGFSEYSFSFTDWSQNISQNWLGGLTSAEAAELQKNLLRFRQRPQLELFKAVQEVLNQFMPAELRAHLERREGHPLAIVTEETSIPWEWLGRPEAPLFTLCSLSRELSQRPTAGCEIRDEPSFLLCGDLLTKQSGCDEDLRVASEGLRSIPAKLISLKGTEELEGLRQLLRGDRFGLAYLAGPCLPELQFGGVTLRPVDFSPASDSSPSLVFFHNYAQTTGQEGPLYAAASDWATRLCAQGCAAFVTNLWPESPAVQRKITRNFFQALSGQATVGESLRLARKSAWAAGHLLAAGYLAFGNSQISRNELHPMRIRQSTTAPGGLASSFQLRVLNGEESGRVIPLFDAVLRSTGLVLGSPGIRRCDVELAGELPNQTVRLTLQNDTILLENLTEQGSWVDVNDLAVRKKMALSRLERIRLGPLQLQLEPIHGKATPTVSVQSAICLEIQEGLNNRTEWYHEELLTIGRESAADIRFLDDSVSRKHAVLQWSGGDLMISRLGQSVLAVNGRAVERPQALAVADKVQLTDHCSLTVLRILP